MPSAVPCRRLPGFVTIGQHDHVAHVVRQIESAQPGSRKRRPGGMPSCQHGGETGLDAFPNQEHVARIGETDGAATARAEHHFLRIDRRLSRTITGEEGAMNREWGIAEAARYQRDHPRPNAARRMFQAGMEAECRRRWQAQAARDEILLGQCTDRLACLTPNAQRSWGPRPIICRPSALVGQNELIA